ncbi:MAG: hypothetical protein RR766_08650 [Longicatena sp.]
MKVQILGIEYDLSIVSKAKDKEICSCDGYCKFFEKRIVINDFINDECWNKESKESIIVRQSHCIRHELIHAFLFESGLYGECRIDESWALSEEIVDWMAIQMPKIMKVSEDINKQINNIRRK